MDGVGEEPEADIKQALAKLRHLNSTFRRKINELKALRVSVEKYHQYEERETLLNQLKELTDLKLEWETFLDSFNTKFGSLAEEKAEDAYEALDKAVVDYLKTKLSIQGTLAKLDNQIPETSGDEQSRTTAEPEPVQDKPEVETEKKSPKRLSLKVSIFLCLCIVVGFYFSLGAIIKAVQDKREESSNEVTTEAVFVLKKDIQTCGAEGFMMRDGVCDDSSNTAECLFDGGDCCKPHKVRTLCLNCTCILEVDPEKLRDDFRAWEIRPVDNDESLQTAIGDLGGWTLEVEDVISLKVCTVLCLDHKKADELNAWHYLVNKEICRCGWVESESCPEKMTKDDWKWENTTDLDFVGGNAFVQLAKTVPCDCLTNGFLLNWEQSDDAKVDHGDGSPKRMSLWHCQELCRLYDDCAWISWRSINSNPAPTADPTKSEHQVHDCKMMKELPSNVTISTYSQVDSDWTSSSVNCAMGLFQKYSFGHHYHFVCPSNRTSPEIPDGAKQSGNMGTSFFIYVNGYPQSEIVVLKYDQDSLVECAHTLVPPEQPLTFATGGVLTVPTGVQGEVEPVAVICGGQFELVDNKFLANDKCLILSASKPATVVVNNNSPGSQNQTITQLSTDGLLNNMRIGAASAVVDNGRMLWVLGGKDNTLAFWDTEFVSVSTAQHSDKFPTNAVGPDLPESMILAHHCLEKVTADIAIMTGGTHYPYDAGHPLGDTLSIDVSTLTWQRQANLDTRRFRHACGAIKLGGDGEKMVVVAAGGLNEGYSPLKKVELLVVNEISRFADYWELGPEVPVPIADAASATTADQTGLFLIGGTTDSFNLDTVFRIVCLADDIASCFWTKVDYELNTPGAQGLALVIMPSRPLVPPGPVNNRDCTKDVGSDESIFMLTTGHVYYPIGDTESYIVPTTYLDTDLDLSGLSGCQPTWKQSMYPLHLATGGLLKVVGHHQCQQESNCNNTTHVPIVCGGESKNNEINYNCYAGAKTVGVMRYSRLLAASTTMSNGSIFWITGGLSPVTTDTTEFINVSIVAKSLTGDSIAAEKLSEGIRLPRKMTQHCLEMASDKIALLYGGRDNENWMVPAFDSTWSMDHLESGPILDQRHQKWTPRAHMAKARYSHGCGVIKADVSYKSGNQGKYVVAAGGAIWINEQTSITSSVELLKVDIGDNVADSWQEGPQLPHSLFGTGSASTEDNAVLFLAGGGKIFQPMYVESESIFSLRCAKGVCWWRQEDQALTHERLNPVAIVIPPADPDTGPLEMPKGSDVCRPSWKGNGLCDSVNNNNRCGFDGGDCCTGEDKACMQCYGDWCKCHETGESKCMTSEDCSDNIELVCDGNNNYPQCDFDGGDCCLPSGNNKYCINCDYNECMCHLTGIIQCTLVPETCEEETLYLGDLFCDDNLNTDECLYDGGDCCMQNIDFTYCDLCLCLHI